MKYMRAYLVLGRNVAQTLAHADEGSDPLCRVPPTSALVTADLADADGSRPETRLPCRTTEELLRYPLTLRVTCAVSNLGANIDRLRTER